MANIFQEYLNVKLKRKRKILPKTHCENTKSIMLNTGSSYNVLHEHNYFCDSNKKRSQQLNKKKYLQNYIDTIPDWIEVQSSSDKEDFDENENKSLSQILKLEHQQYLLDAVKLYLIMF